MQTQGGSVELFSAAFTFTDHPSQGPSSLPLLGLKDNLPLTGPEMALGILVTPEQKHTGQRKRMHSMWPSALWLPPDGLSFSSPRTEETCQVPFLTKHRAL